MNEVYGTNNAKLLHESRSLMYREAKKYRQTFINKNSGFIDEKYLERRVCPVCKADSGIKIFHKDGGTYVKCAVCTMVYLNPVLKDDELIKYYRLNNSNQAQSHIDQYSFYSSIYQSGLDLISKYKNQGNLLDIGCSGGMFLDMAAHHFIPFGVELNQQESKLAIDKGYTVWSDPIDMIDLKENEKFDVITLWDVFEHIKDGISYLKKLALHLNETGVIFLQIPNERSLAARILQDKCNMFDGIEHVNLYSIKTLSLVAKTAGFSLVEVRSVIDELKPILNYLEYEDPYKGEFAYEDSVMLPKPKEILTTMIGYKLQIVVQKLHEI